jgi:lipoate-protein ligase A
MPSNSVWRLILSPPGGGPENMAIDEAILQQARLGHVAPTLRLYAWDPPCLSLGRAQPLEDVDMDRLRAEGWDWVRRPTGGRAILHTDELTYSVAGTMDHPDLGGGVLDSYRRLSHGLVRALELLGVTPDPLSGTPADEEGRRQPICFEAPSAYEITVGGRKLVGSAQVRRGGGVLQHGTLPLRGDLTRICRALRYPDEASRQAAGQRLIDHAATLEQVLGRTVSWEEAAGAFAKGFEQALGWHLRDDGLTGEERGRAIPAAALP